MSVTHAVPSRRRKEAPALSSPPKPREPSSSPLTKYLKPTGTSTSVRPTLSGHAIDHAAAHDGLAHRRVHAPARPVAEQIRDARGQIVVGIEEPGAPGHDAVAVGVGVIGEGEIEAVAQADEAGHGIGRGRVHPDLAVPVDGHEPKRRVDRLVHDVEPQAVPLGDGRPVPDAGAPERIHADPERAAAERRHVDDGAEPVDIVVDVREAVHGRRAARALVRDARDAGEPRGEELIGPVLDPPGDLGVGGAARWRIVLEAAGVGRIVRGRDDDAVGESCRFAAAAVVVEDGLRDDRRRHRAVVAVEHDVDAVRGEHLERARAGGLGQRMGVAPEEERPVDPLGLPVETDGLGHGEDMRLVEARRERRAAMSRGAERHALPGEGGVGPLGVVRRDEARNIREERDRGRLARERIDARRAHPRTSRAGRRSQAADPEVTIVMTLFNHAA